MTKNLPPGYVFAPSEEELIVHYLENKVNGHSLPMHINEDNVYLYNPWQLIQKYPLQRFDEGCLYLFSPLHKLSEGGNKRPSRSAGDGHYRSSRCYPIISSEGNTIGYETHLKFYMGKPSNKDDDDNKTNWLLTEYRLMNKQPNNNNKTTLDECVLCKLYYNDQKEDEDEDDESRKRKRFTTSTTTEEDQKEEDNKNNDPLSLSQQQQQQQQLVPAAAAPNIINDDNQIDQHESNPPNPNPNLSVEEWESYFNITLDQHLEEKDEDDDDTLFFNQLNQADYPPQHYFDDPPYNLAPQHQHNHNEIDNHIENLLQLLNDNCENENHNSNNNIIF
ncbi:hypothetical protein F8388_008359 [Cannabis sativa]|uniref:NAC domain-containing protein n=1 Tax=Cannabis sativa TaxID=3483 RepID=A0A7J6GM25_CANSA|nr:hypothetical protein F8388_008359 [Cannabis sativa]KAF4383974.1 hypothetical protein G4B88_016407 [Cannabis sativa]